MKVIDHIKNATSTLFSIEILPPLKGQNIDSIFETLETVKKYNPAFINVTYHREEYVYRDAGNGLLEKRTVRKRPGTVGICSAIKNKYNIDPVPHIICGGFTKTETEDALIDLNFLDIDNVLLLRGDPIKSEKQFYPEPGGFEHTIDLVKQVVNMNNGIFLEEEIKGVVPTNFCIGIAGYPEKHYEAPSLKSDLKWLKAKVDAGADYIITQLFFDNQKYFDFVRKCRSIGITVPIIPGLKPIQRKSQLISIPKNFYIDLPDDLVDEVEKAKSDKDVAQIGVEWCIQQCKELIEFGVPVLHFYTMGKAIQTAQIAKAVF